MTESTFAEAKTLHEQMESILGFLDAVKDEEVTHVEMVCGDHIVKINKSSKVYQTVKEFLEQALLGIQDKFNNI